jgi:hypothetical protein
LLKFSNFGKALIGSAPSGTTGLNFTVEAGKGVNFPALDSGDYFYGIFKDASGNREIVKIEARSGDAMTIAIGGRGLDGTTARTWNAGDYFVAGLPNIALQETLSNVNLTALGALASAADKLPYFTGSGTAALADLSAFARTLLDDADAAAMRATLGIPAVVAAVIPAGSVIPFFQANAPTGWTKVTTHANKAIRIVAGTGGGSGGSQPFTTAFNTWNVTGNVGYHALTVDEIPPHSHLVSSARKGTGSSFDGGYFLHTVDGLNASTQNTGSGWGHNHPFTGNPINLAVQYIDMILASKD